MEKEIPWEKDLPRGAFITCAPSYIEGEFADLFEEDTFVGEGNDISMKYYFYDPTEHGWPKRDNYPVLIFLHGLSNALVGKLCVTYAGAEHFAAPSYQEDMKGCYILVPLANEYRDENGDVQGCWSDEHRPSVYNLINDFIAKHTEGVGNKFLLGNSAGANMTFRMAELYQGFFTGLVPVGAREIPSDEILDEFEKNGTYLFYAMGKRDEMHDFKTEVEPRLAKLNKMKRCFVFTPDWVKNADGGVASINFGFEMGQHCLMNAIQSNLKFLDGTPMDTRLSRGMTGWLDEANRNGSGRGRNYPPCGGVIKTGRVQVDENVSLFYEEFGSGDNIILSAQMGFYHDGMQQRMAEMGYHVYCITLRGFHPSSLVKEDYKEKWFDVFASDVIVFADKMKIDRFTYMGASHGAGVGWHLMLMAGERVKAFIAMVPGPHSLKEGTMSYRQMVEQGILKEVPPFDPPIANDEDRQARRDIREDWISNFSEAFEDEKKLDYGRPLMKMVTEENLCEALKTITVPTLIIGAADDPISTPELIMRTARCLPYCKLVMYSNCGHNIDTDIYEEVSDEADRFLKNVFKTGRVYIPPCGRG